MRSTAWIGLLVGAVLAPAVAAYPIRPVHLWSLVHEADVVVLATVERADDPKRREESTFFDDFLEATLASVGIELPDPTRRPCMARLRVLEDWKGTSSRRVDVPFDCWIICPSPPRFVAGETIVAFLTKSAGDWHVVAGSYGVRTLEPKTIAPLRERVREAVSLEARGSVNTVRQVEWLVACYERPETRRDALDELGLQPWSEPDREQALHLARLVTPDLARRLGEAMLANPPGLIEMAQVAHLVRSTDSEELTELFIRVVEQALRYERNRWYLGQAMAETAARLGVPDAHHRFAALSPDFSAQREPTPPVEDFRRAWEAANAAAPVAPR